MEKKKLECVDLSYSIGGRQVLNQLSFTLEAGELVWLRGANGAGKSTLLRLISGAIMPDNGHIHWNGTSHEILYIGHKHGYFSSLSVYDTLNFWSHLYDTAPLLNAAISYFDFDPFLDFACHELSAGWQQKLALCRLILQPSALWLLDEPANNLDAGAVELLSALIQSRKEQGGIVLMTMHGHNHADDAIRCIDLTESAHHTERAA